MVAPYRMDSDRRWSPMQLRSLMLLANSQILIRDGAKIIEQILLVCPRLCTLVVGSQELALCLEQNSEITLPSLSHLHIYLGDLRQMVTPAILATAFPHISYFSTGKSYLPTNLELGYAALRLIKALPYLRLLRFNDLNFAHMYDLDKYDNSPLVLMLKNCEELRSVNCYVKLYQSIQLIIWLWELLDCRLNFHFW